MIGVVMVPVYISYMGAEAYGLVGFFSMLQASFMLLDLGLTPTVAREAARFEGGSTDDLSYRKLMRAFEIVFAIVGVFGAVVLVGASGFVASRWLKASELPTAEILTSVQLMGVCVALRWMCGLYRGVITGSERLVWLGVFGSVLATLRFVGVLPLFIFVGVTPTLFFSFQFGLAIVELVCLKLYSYQLMPAIKERQTIGWGIKPLKPVLGFSMSVAFTSILWVLVTQTDKILLSAMLPLKEYGYFSLAVLGANAIAMASGPVRGALMPRMTKLTAQGDMPGMELVYHKATQLLSIITIPATLVLAFFAEPVLWMWTGDREIAEIAAPVLMLYAIGNGLSAIASVAYCLQYSHGNLRLHVVETLLFVVLFLPALMLSVGEFGLDGAGYAWAGTMAVFFVFWLPIIHRRFLKSTHFNWLVLDIGPAFVTSFVIAVLAYCVMRWTDWPIERLPIAGIVAGIGLVTLAAGAISTPLGREFVGDQIRMRFGNRLGTSGSVK